MIARLLIVLIRVYQWTISPLLGNVCRFHPSCSRYAAQCLESHGALRGSWLSLRRLLRCHPFNPGGYDPPPSLELAAENASETTARQPNHATRLRPAAAKRSV